MTLKRPEFQDIFIIGGGINGLGIARDAVGRGFSVTLCEANDLGSGTSSASTKLVHGGLRYLEHYEFALVRKALKEREILWKMAPHIIWPLRFILPYHSGLRPAWMLRLGLFLYDYIGGRKLLPPTQSINLQSHPTGQPLKGNFKKGFEYSDCWVEDSRMVVLNAQDTLAKGGDIRTRTKVTKAEKIAGGWQITVEDQRNGKTDIINAKLLINAAGPWVDEVLAQTMGRNDAKNVRLVRGSHIVVPKIYDHDRAYIFQNTDDRIIFAIPYERDFTLIGTTDADHGKTMGEVKIAPEEVDYLCEMASAYFNKPVTQKDVVWTYSGVRPLFDDGATKAQEATRDYVIRQEGDLESGALLNIFGGKITTYRVLGEAMMEYVEALLGQRGPAWTENSTLPGGDFGAEDYDKICAQYTAQYPNIDKALIARLVRAYGTRTLAILNGKTDMASLGQSFGAGLYEAEIRYQIKHEWSECADDVLFRRTKLGIRMTPAERQKVDDFIKAKKDES